MQRIWIIALLVLTPATGWSDHYRPPTQDEIDKSLRRSHSQAFQEKLRTVPTPIPSPEAEEQDRLWNEHADREDRENRLTTLPDCPTAEEEMARAEERTRLGQNPPPTVLPKTGPQPQDAKGRVTGNVDCFPRQIREYRARYRAWHKDWLQERQDRDHPTWEEYYSAKQKAWEDANQGRQ